MKIALNLSNVSFKNLTTYNAKKIAHENNKIEAN